MLTALWSAVPDVGDDSPYAREVTVAPAAPAALDHGMVRGITAFRAIALAWAWVGLVVERDHLDRPWLAVVGMALATAMTLVLVAVLPSLSRISWRLVAVELALGCGLLVLDGVVYDALRQQSLPWAWPAAGVIMAAVAGGLWWGSVAAVAVAAASFVGESILRDSLRWSTSAASKSALFLLAGVVAALAAQRLRQAEREISLARAREETARVLHDGVLQTLAVIHRRSDDEALRTLAADQERELRAYVAGRAATASLADRLRAIVTTVDQRHQLRTEVALAGDLPALEEPRADALVGAVGEALTNAAKHSGSGRAVLFAEPSDDGAGVFCSVADDGVGFDGNSGDGLGLEHSIRRRIEDVGGRVEVETAVGRGTEVRMWLA